jgi:hypothetical protein
MSILLEHRHITSLVMVTVVGVSALAVQGCDPGDVAEQCGLACSAKGFVGGDAKISGIASIDALST